MTNDDRHAKHVDDSADEPGTIAGSPTRTRKGRKKSDAPKAGLRGVKTTKVTPAGAATTEESETSPSDRVLVKVGSVELWMDSRLAATLTDKDRRKLKAVFKRSVKRSAKSAKPKPRAEKAKVNPPKPNEPKKKAGKTKSAKKR